MSSRSAALSVIKFARAGDLKRARLLFDKISQPDLRTATLLISAYSQHGLPLEAVHLYRGLRSDPAFAPDQVMLLSVAKACASLGDLDLARDVHDDTVHFRMCGEGFVGNALIDMYAKCKCVEGAGQIFREMPLSARDVVSWTSLCSCYVNCHKHMQALDSFREMVLSGMMPNPVILSLSLSVCSKLNLLNLGKELHSFIIRHEMDDNNVHIGTALIDLYSRCSTIGMAQSVFDRTRTRDTVCWNAILVANFKDGNHDRGFTLFDQMRKEGVRLTNASWNIIIRGCVQREQNESALDIFRQMQVGRFRPDQITIATILPVCGNLELLCGGKTIHSYVLRNNLTNGLAVETALILMYAKCGDLEMSQKVFNSMSGKDVVAWNTIIIANSMHGDGVKSLDLFYKMLGAGIRPNSVTFTGVLSGCSHSRLVEAGLSIFDSMEKDHYIKPQSDHYSCLVDLLSRAGRLQEAYEFILQNPAAETAPAFGALLSACKVHKNVELGILTATRLFEIEPDNPGNYVSLFNIFVAAKRWDEAAKIRKMLRDRGIAKRPGISWIRVRNKTYRFLVGEKSNEQTEEISRFLQEIRKKMNDAGYLPETENVMQDINEAEKEEALCNHSEKLAVAFGVLNSTSGQSTIRVYKNLRICQDCHNVIKFIAKVVRKQIIIRDSTRFHHFGDGSCSCGDFW